MVSLTSLATTATVKTAAATARPRLGRIRARLPFLGPAFVAAIAYVDPGNFATNVGAGARHGYLLLWVLVAANLAACVVQYLSAKLGLVTGASLPRLLGTRLRPPGRIGYWLQAEAVVMATDVAEVVGGAVALRILFGWPPVVGGLVTGLGSTVLLAVRDRRGRRAFQAALTVVLGALAAAFVLAVLNAPPSPSGIAHGLLPRFDGTDSVLLAAGMIGATVMPHAIYLHSDLTPDNPLGSPRPDDVTASGPDQGIGNGPGRDAAHRGRPGAAARRGVLAGIRIDVGLAMLLAGGVNVAMLLFSATTTRGADDVDTLAGAHAAIARAAGPTCALLFAVTLLISGLAASAVGGQAGAVVMDGLLHRRLPAPLRRLITLVPALAVLASGLTPTQALIGSQIVLSFGIPFALLPLLSLTANRHLMGPHTNHPATTITATAITTAVIVVNATLLTLTFL